MTLSASKQVLFQLRRCISKETALTATRSLSTTSANSSLVSNVAKKELGPIVHQPLLRIQTFSDVATKQETDTNVIEVDVSTPTQTHYKEWTPSVLESLPENYSSSDAWDLLSKALEGNKQCRHADFSSVCKAAQPGSLDDVEAIRTALHQLKRYHHFKLSLGLAQDAMEGISRGITDEKKSAQETIDSLAHFGSIFATPRYGLWVSADVSAVEKFILEPMLQALERLEEEGTVEASDDETKRPEDVAMHSVKEVYNMLYFRGSAPTNDMKKRKKRRYLKYRVNCSGPSPDTLDTVIKIVLKAENPHAVRVGYGIVEKFTKRKWFGAVLPSTLAHLEEVEAKVKAAEAEEDIDEDGTEDNETEE